jgi:hypothetical protein
MGERKMMRAKPSKHWSAEDQERFSRELGWLYTRGWDGITQPDALLLRECHAPPPNYVG